MFLKRHRLNRTIEILSRCFFSTINPIFLIILVIAIALTGYILSVDTQSSIKYKIDVEQIKILHDAMPALFAINIAIGAALAYAFWDVVAHTSILICLTLLVVMVLVRGIFYLRYQNNFDPNNLPSYRISLIAGSASAGIIWGMIGVLFFPADEQIYQFFLLLSLLAMTGGSAFTLSIYLPSYFAYVPMTILPIIVQFLIIGGKFNITLAIGASAFLIILTVFNLKVNKNFKTSIALRFENLELIEQLQLQKEESEKANNAKSKFLAAASHDLRQPLYALNLFTSLLEETVQDPKGKNVVEQINASVNSLTNLFDKLLDISQLDAGVIKVNKQDFSLSKTFDTLMQMFNPLATQKGLTIEWPQNYLEVHSQPELLEQIIRNYLSNAIKYTPQGVINVTCDNDDGLITITISDSGIGISEQALDNVYEEFYQVDNIERDREKGLGLGLSIVQRTAKLLGHDIAVSSIPGKGSAFSISVEQAKTVIVESQLAANIPSLEQYNSSALILVIDNEADIREGLNSVLQLWGYQVITAASLDDAQQQLTSKNIQPDIIISDYRLKGGNTGVHAIKALHETYDKPIPALIITGDIAVGPLLDMDKSDFQVLFKPVAPMKLRAFLRYVS
jgi:signal transduction histidine kinase/CheY-like chemotaxis protein